MKKEDIVKLYGSKPSYQHYELINLMITTKMKRNIERIDK